MWLAVWLLAQTAAAEPMTWEWDKGQTRRYVAGSIFQSPHPVVLSNDRTAWVRSKKFALQLAMTCEPESALSNGRGWNMECPIEDASAWAVPVAEDAQHARKLLGDLQEILKRSSVGFRLSNEGRLSQVRLIDTEGEAPPKHQREILDLLLTHTMSSLDVQLGDTDEPHWALPQAMAADFPLEGIQSQFNGRVSQAGTDHRALVLMTYFEGGYAFDEVTYKGDAVQKSYYDPVDQAVQQASVRLGAFDRTGATTTGFTFTTYIRQVRDDDEITISASKGW